MQVVLLYNLSIIFQEDKTERLSENFSNKTDELIKYIEKTYLNGFAEDNNKLMNKMKISDESEKKVMNYGFDALFMNNDDKNKKN